MQIKADEISAIIKEKIKGFDKQVDVKETGSVIQVGDGIAKVYGLDGAMAGEMLEFPGGLYGIAHKIEPDTPYSGNGYTATDLTRIPSTFAEAIELWRNSEVAVECFGDEVHHHVLVHAEAEWLAFNKTVTDWERARYFERI